LAQEKLMSKEIEHKIIQPPRSWVLIVRPFLVLGCFLVGFIMFDRIIIQGSLLDGETTPKWSDDGIDLNSARKAICSADFAEAELILLRLVTKQPHFGEAHRMLGRLYLQQDRFDDALRHYRVARYYLPGDGEPAIAIEQITKKTTSQPADAPDA